MKNLNFAYLWSPMTLLRKIVPTAAAWTLLIGLGFGGQAIAQPSHGPAK